MGYITHLDCCNIPIGPAEWKMMLLRELYYQIEQPVYSFINRLIMVVCLQFPLFKASLQFLGNSKSTYFWLPKAEKH